MNKFLYGRTFSSRILGFVVYLNAAFAKERKNVRGRKEALFGQLQCEGILFCCKHRMCLNAYKVASRCYGSCEINEGFNTDGSKAFVLRKTRWIFLYLTNRLSVCAPV